jgi:hypothetical protein
MFWASYRLLGNYHFVTDESPTIRELRGRLSQVEFQSVACDTAFLLP